MSGQKSGSVGVYKETSEKSAVNKHPIADQQNCFGSFLSNPSPLTIQHMSLDHKIMHSKKVIREFYNAMEGKVSVSFSGGKDSTVMLHLIRSVYPDVPAVFYDTGLEFPEIVSFVKEHENVTIIRPGVSFKQVIERWGYPVIGKEVAHYTNLAKKGTPSGLQRFTGENSRYDYSKYKYLIDAPFKISEYCCNKLKKQPAYKYYKETGNGQFIGSRNEESLRRETAWLEMGENRYDTKTPTSNPLSIWKQKDVDAYIERHKLPLSTVYTEMGYERTGCMFCMFGVHLDDTPNRFQIMRRTHPKRWEWCMRSVADGGLGLQEVLDYIKVPSGAGQTSLEVF